ncbi:MAG: creatininase family protein [Planctomycetaceae bacterium]
MTPRPYVLAETNWETVRQTKYETAVLPWGATEAHNRHLPYATDTIQADGVAVEAARLAWERGARPLVLPGVPFGVNTGQLEVPFCLNMNPSTQQALLADLLPVLERHGIRKLVILNGHGGNCFRQIIRELQPRTRLLLCQLHWFRCVDPRPYFDVPGDHAGELETSVIQFLSPELARPLSEAGEGRESPYRVTAFREGWAWTQRRWDHATEDTGAGSPAAASAEKGERFFRAVTEQIAGFLVELQETDPQQLHIRE